MSGKLAGGYVLVPFESVDSTNEEAKRIIRSGVCGDNTEKTVIIARQQTQGKGRDGRSWHSPVGNVYCSIIVKPNVTSRYLPQLSFVTALAVRDVLKSILPEGVSVEYKWPNDILVDKRKIVGILLETETINKDPNLRRMVVGIGLNIVSCPDETILPATCLAHYMTLPPSVLEWTELMVESFDRKLNLWEENGFEPIRQAWLESVYGLNEEIHVRLPRKELSGVFKGINHEGALVLKLEPDQEELIPAGDVFFESLAPVLS